MSDERCGFCGENLLDCCCDEIHPWYCFDDTKPVPGQKCLVKNTQILEAYYSPKYEDEFYVVGCHDTGVITAWKPIIESKKVGSYDDKNL
jgi:hypothetical protein